MTPFTSCVGAVKNGHFVIGEIEVTDEILETELGAVLSDLIALLVLIIEELIGEWNIVVNHVLPTVVAHIEDLGAEAEPVEETVNLLADVGLSPGRHFLWEMYIRPSRRPPSMGWRCISIASLIEYRLHHLLYRLYRLHHLLWTAFFE